MDPRQCSTPVNPLKPFDDRGDRRQKQAKRISAPRRYRSTVVQSVQVEYGQLCYRCRPKSYHEDGRRIACALSTDEQAQFDGPFLRPTAAAHYRAGYCRTSCNRLSQIIAKRGGCRARRSVTIWDFQGCDTGYSGACQSVPGRFHVLFIVAIDTKSGG